MELHAVGLHDDFGELPWLLISSLQRSQDLLVLLRGWLHEQDLLLRTLARFLALVRLSGPLLPSWIVAMLIRCLVAHP